MNIQTQEFFDKLVACYHRVQGMVDRKANGRIVAIYIDSRMEGIPFIRIEYDMPKNNRQYFVTDLLFAPFGMDVDDSPDAMERTEGVVKITNEMLESVERQVSRERKQDFTRRGKLLQQIQYGCGGFLALYGYEMRWGVKHMYDGPLFSLYDGQIEMGHLCQIGEKFISVQDMNEDDMMYSLRIGALSTERLEKLATIVAQALSNPPPRYEAVPSVEVLPAEDSKMGLRIVGHMPAEMLARQVK